MTDFLVSQLDYIFFLYGLGFILLAVNLSLVLTHPNQPRRWNWLLIFAAVHGVCEWLDMLALSLGDHPIFSTIRSILVAISFLALFLFGWCSLPRHRHRWPLLVVPILATLAGWHEGAAGLQAASRYALAFPGSLLAAWSLWEIGRSYPISRKHLHTAAVAMIGYGIIAGLVANPAPFWPASVINSPQFLQWTGIPIQLIRCLLALIMAAAIWRFQYRLTNHIHEQANTSVILRETWVMLGLLTVVLLGGVITQRLGRFGTLREYNQHRTELELLEQGFKNVVDQADRMVITLSREPDVVAYMNQLALGKSPDQPPTYLLDRYRQIIPRAVCYLMDKNGLTADSSNRHAPDSFVGKNFNHREYFQQAIHGQPGRYVTVGIISRLPGYYASYPIMSDSGGILGVAVMKMNLDQLTIPTLNNRYGMLVNTQGTVLFSSQPEHSLSRLEPQLVQQLGSPSGNSPRSADMFDLRVQRFQTTFDGQEMQVYWRETGIGNVAVLVMNPVKLTKLYRLFGILLALLLSLLVSFFFLIQQRTQNAADRLASLAKRYQSMFMDNSAVMLLSDPANARILEANHAARKYYGYDDARWENLKLTDVNPLPEEEILTALHKSAHRLGDGSYQFKHRLANGEVRDVEVHSSPLEMNGQLCVYSIVHDVTERIKAQNELIKLSQAVEQCSVSVVITNLKGEIEYVNPKFCDVTGYAISEVLGKNPRVLKSDQSDQNIDYRQLWQTINSGQSWTGIFHNQKKNGQVYWESATISPIRNQQGQITHFLAIKEDITERKLIEEALVQAMRDRQAVLDAASEVSIIATDLNGRITLFNRGAENLLGYHSHDLVARQTPMLFHDPAEVDECARMLSRRLDRPVSGFEIFALISEIPELAKREWTYIRKDARRLEVELVVSCVRDSQGNITGYLGVAQDISQRKQAERHLLKARTAAEAANQAKSDFLANMSHEIRTPMTAILGYTDLMLNPNLPDKQRQEHLHVIQRNGRHLLTVINDILDLSKIESGKMTVEFLQTPLPPLIAEVASMVRERALSKGLEFRIDYHGAIPANLHTDPTRLKQILINLLGNAIKFTEKGRVGLYMKLLNWPGNQPILQLQVCDTGIGMSKEQMANLFKPFTQADTSTTRRFGGTGLGLSISKHLVEMLGGRISVDSEPNEGTAITLAIPTGPLDDADVISSPSESIGDLFRHQETQATLTDASLKGMRLLLAEDGQDNRRLIMSILQQHGASVQSVENGLLACDAAAKALKEEKPFDVVILDMQMPVMDGYTAARTLRQQGYNRPIIALTANAMNSDRQRCLNAGCDEFASKPIEREKLIRLLASLKDRALTGSVESAEIQADAVACSPSDAQPTLPASSDEPLASEYADDESMHHLLTDYVNDLPDRMARIQQALEKEDFTAVAWLAHQIKGSAGSYGYTPITKAAETLECLVETNQQDLDRIKAAMQELNELCHRAIAPTARNAKPRGSTPSSS